MNKKAIITLGVLSIPLGFLSTETAQARSVWNADGNWVTMTRNVKILKIRNVVPRYKSYQVNTYTAKKGSHYKMEHWGIDYSWVLNSGKFKSNSRYTYVVSASAVHTSWFKFGIHKISSPRRYKTFHGYRITTKKNDLSSNTFYDKTTHSTISDYRPTQKSKVIFDYGSHVYPTHHEWFYGPLHGKDADYRYRNGSWHRID